MRGPVRMRILNSKCVPSNNNCTLASLFVGHHHDYTTAATASINHSHASDTIITNQRYRNDYKLNSTKRCISCQGPSSRFPPTNTTTATTTLPSNGERTTALQFSSPLAPSSLLDRHHPSSSRRGLKNTQHQQMKSTTSWTSTNSAAAAAATTTAEDQNDMDDYNHKFDQETEVMKNMLHRVRKLNTMPDEIRKSLIHFYVDGIPLGKVRPQIAELLCNTFVNVHNKDSKQKFPIFCLMKKNNSVDKNNNGDDDDDVDSKDYFLTLTPEAGATCESRTRSVNLVMEQLRDDQESKLVNPKRWRNELYPVSNSFYSEPVFLMERSVVSVLGALEYGIHINGIVNVPYETTTTTTTHNGNNNMGDTITKTTKRTKKMMWMSRRSKNSSKCPGLVDHMVAGGQPAGISLMDNVIKECFEEAGIPEHVTRESIHRNNDNSRRDAFGNFVVNDEDEDDGFLCANSVISFERYSKYKDTVTRCVLFCYDLHLPPPNQFQPEPVDGEVEDFFLLDINDIKDTMDPDSNHDKMKPTCYIVLIDYLLRNGYLSPEIPGYLDLIRELRSGDCY